MCSQQNPVVVEHLSFFYGQENILSNVSFRIEEGEFIGIIGPNGGGKTTLLRLLMGLLRKNEGTISIFGKDPYENASILKNIAYVPQSVRYDKEFPISVEEVVLSGLLSELPWYGMFTAEQKERARQALENVNLLAFMNHSFGRLSGGQAQRVLIARALVSKPKLLFLDEPTASVDTQAQAEIYGILKNLKGKMTILMVTHDLRTAIDQVDRVLCVQKEVNAIKTKDVCEHFALGLYHFPLIQTSLEHNLSHFRMR